MHWDPPKVSVPVADKLESGTLSGRNSVAGTTQSRAYKRQEIAAIRALRAPPALFDGHGRH